MESTRFPPVTFDVVYVPFEKIQLSESNPRTSIDKNKLDELKRSIRSVGLWNPITVRARGDAWEIIAGERRFTALKQLHEEDPMTFARVPVIQRDVDDVQLPVVQLVENVQRADLTAVEIAEGVARAMEVAGVTEDAVAAELGWSKSTVKKYVQLHHAPGWLRELGSHVAIPTKKVDANGQPVIDPKTNRQAIVFDEKPGLEFSFLMELLRLFNKLQKIDKDRYAADGSHRAMAEIVTRKLAYRAASEAWSRAKLESEIERTIANVTGGNSAKKKGEGKKPYLVDDKKLVVDGEGVRALALDERRRFAVQAQTFLRELGFAVTVEVA